MALRDDVISGKIKVEPVYDAAGSPCADEQRQPVVLVGRRRGCRRANRTMAYLEAAMTRPSPSSAAEPHDIVVLEHVTKRFPGVVANDSVDLASRSGEVHVLLGENGAGKSTLIGMLSGLQQPDEGRIMVDGKPDAIPSPRHALPLGIGTVFQHVMLVPTLTVAENLLLGGPWWRRPGRGRTAGRARCGNRQGSRICSRPRCGVRSLSLGEQQQVEIIRAPAAQQPGADSRRIDLHAGADRALRNSAR